jgi:hypothetical protein
MPLMLYLSVCGCCFTKFCKVFGVLKVIFICVSLNSSIIFPFFFPVLWVGVCILPLWGVDDVFLILFSSYLLFCIMLFMMFHFFRFF